jgi:exopolysaccharide biosynthesis polyprenyl glycosylphosphotransferase
MYSHNLLLERTQRAIIDGIAVFVAALIAVWIRHGANLNADSTQTPWTTYLFPAAVIATLTVVTLQLSGWYRRPHSVVSLRVLLGSLGFATMIALALSFFYRVESYSRASVLIFLPLATLLVIAARFAYDRYVRALARARVAARRVLIVGQTPSGMRLAKALEKRPMYYELIGILDDSSNVTVNGTRPRVLGKVSALSHLVNELTIDEVLICLPSEPDRVMDVIGECMRRNVTWKVMPNMFGLRLDRMSVDDIDGIPLIGPHSTRLVGFNWLLKRGFDLALAMLALILLSPVFLVVGLAVLATSRGPVLYKQTRVGVDGRTFTMLKFRSMRIGSSTEIHSNYTREWIYGRTGSSENTNGNGHGNGNGTTPADEPGTNKMTDDPRITGVGKFMRATSLDELPQLWNVVRGEMSIVGPRPALPYEVDQYTEWHKRRLATPPGITGAWQVSGRNDLSFEEMVALDVNYIERWSFERDIKIVLRTVPAVLKFGGK